MWNLNSTQLDSKVMIKINSYRLIVDEILSFPEENNLLFNVEKKNQNKTEKAYTTQIVSHAEN